MTSCGCYPNYIDALSIIMDQIYRDEKTNQIVNESRKIFAENHNRGTYRLCKVYSTVLIY